MDLVRAPDAATKPAAAERQPSAVGAVLTGVATAIAIEILRPPSRTEVTIVVEDSLE